MKYKMPNIHFVADLEGKPIPLNNQMLKWVRSKHKHPKNISGNSTERKKIRMKNKPFFNGDNNNNNNNKEKKIMVKTSSENATDPKYKTLYWRIEKSMKMNCFSLTHHQFLLKMPTEEKNEMIKTCRQLFTLISNFERLECRMNQVTHQKRSLFRSLFECF